MGGVSTRTVACVGLVGVALSWGVAFCLVKSAVAEVPPAELVATRFGIAALVLTLARPSVLREIGPEVLHGIPLGLLLGAGFLLQTSGLQTTSVVVSAFVTGSVVIFAPFVARVWIQTRIGLARILAVGLATAGLGLITLRGVSSGWGELLTLSAAALWAVHLVGLEVWTCPERFHALALVQVATVSAVAWVASAAQGSLPALAGAPTAWLGVAVLGAVATGAAFLVLTWAQNHVDATTAAVILTLEPVFGAISATIFSGESIGPIVAVGAVAVLAGALLVAVRAPVVPGTGAVERPAAPSTLG